MEKRKFGLYKTGSPVARYERRKPSIPRRTVRRKILEQFTEDQTYPLDYS